MPKVKLSALPLEVQTATRALIELPEELGTTIVDFTYSLTTNVGKLRLEIGDITNGTGVKPDGNNFSDTELNYFLSQEGSTVGRAAARACEVLARMFAGMVDLTAGPRRESLSQAAKAYADRANELRRQYGGATSGAYSAGFLRSASGHPSDEYPRAGNEYTSGNDNDWWSGT